MLHVKIQVKMGGKVEAFVGGGGDLACGALCTYSGNFPKAGSSEQN